MASNIQPRSGLAARPADPPEWLGTSLGTPSGWPATLRHAADICRHSHLPSAIVWGDDRVFLHNGAWRELVGASTQGVPAAEALGALWRTLGRAAEEALAGGEGRFLREQTVTLERNGVPEEVWLNCNVVPLLGEGGAPAGALLQANDVTRTVNAERRLSFQIALADRLRRLTDPEEVKRIATQLLGEHLGAARVGYAEIDEAHGTVVVRGDWTRDGAVASLGGQSGVIRSFGEEALALLRGGEVLALPDIRLLALGGSEITEAWEALGVRALITVPLVRDGGLKALLYVHEPQPRYWRRSEAAIARDVAERTWAAVERAQAEQSLRDSEDHYRHTVELNPQVTWTALPDGRLNRVSNRWEVWTGTSGLGDSWGEAVHPDDRERSFAAWRACVESGTPYDIEHRVCMRDGSYRWARSRAWPRRDDEGSICLWYGSTEDVHERRQAEEHQRLLINELNHRVKNTLATVQAIAFQTLKGDVSLAEARSRFEARLMALSRAHNLLTERNWGGAALDRVVRDATEHLSGERGRFDLAGEPILLSPRAALAMAMALHELATNAVKYGALSNEGGRVSIAWRVAEGELVFEWKERDGPRVAEPARRGFGTRLIEKGLESDLGGTARLAFEPDGLLCRVTADIAAIAADEGALD